MRPIDVMRAALLAISESKESTTEADAAAMRWARRIAREALDLTPGTPAEKVTQLFDHPAPGSAEQACQGVLRELAVYTPQQLVVWAAREGSDHLVRVHADPSALPTNLMTLTQYVMRSWREGVQAQAESDAGVQRKH